MKQFFRSIFLFVFCCLFAYDGEAFTVIQAKKDAKSGKSAKPQSKEKIAEGKPQKKIDPTPQVAEAIKKLKTEFENEIAIRETRIKSLSEKLQTKQQLFNQGIIARKEMQEMEAELAAARAELAARRRKVDGEIETANNLAAEVAAAEQLAKTPLRGRMYVATNALIRYNGSMAWVISDITKVSAYFVSTFNHALPISAFGQTEVHNQLGFDHSNSVDVALHPDSPEGQALINYLRNAGIPFLAFRQAVPGAATAAHIHIGYPSHRFIR